MNTRALSESIAQVERRYRKIAAQLTPADLQRSDEDAPLESLADLGFGLGDERASRTALFVGYYTEDGLREALSRYGFLATMARRLGLRGEDELVLSIDTGTDPFHHVLRISVAPEVPFDAPDRLAMELRLHLREHPTESLGDHPAGLTGDDAPPGGGYVVSEWLTLQNPRAVFSPDRPALPGQRAPGLGLGAEIQTLLAILTERLGRQGLLAYPAYCHTAAMYSLRFFAVDPRAEGRTRALLRDAEALSLAELSWAVELGCVRSLRDDGTADVLSWTASELLLPVGAAARAYLDSPAYRRLRDESFARHRFVIDRDLLRQRWPPPPAEAAALSEGVYRAAAAAHRGR